MKLPDILLELIFSFIPKKQQIELTYVCKEFKNLI